METKQQTRSQGPRNSRGTQSCRVDRGNSSFRTYETGWIEGDIGPGAGNILEAKAQGEGGGCSRGPIFIPNVAILRPGAWHQ